MSVSLVQLVSLVLTVLLVVGAGVVSARSVKSAEGFSLSGRSAGVGLVAGGITGAAVGGSATIGTAQMAAVFGLSAWWFTLGCGAGLIVLALFYARPLRRSGLETIPQYLSVAYGPGAGPMMSLVSSLGILFSTVSSSLSGIHLIVAMFGVAHWQAAAIMLGLVITYVVFGGMKGAGVSGLLKMAVLGGALCVAGGGAAMTLVRMPDFATVFPTFPWLSLWGGGSSSEVVSNLLSMIVGIVCTQTYVQAVYSASDARVATVGTLTAAAITIPVGLPSVAIGMFMHARHPELAPVMALPTYLVRYLPDWAGGIGLAGILLSVVGSTAGLAFGIGTMAANDIGRGVLRIVSDARILLINRVSVAVVTCVALAIALASLDSYVLDWNYTSMTLRGAGVFIPLTLAAFWPGALPPAWALASMAASTLAAVVCRVVLAGSLNPLFAGLSVSIAIVAVALFMRAVSVRAAAASAARETSHATRDPPDR